MCFIKNHLGNGHVYFSDTNKNGIVEVVQEGNHNELLQQEHYYPFGMPIRGEWKFVQPQVGGVNYYQYNDKELNDDFGLNWNDYGARWYDASIGRWNGVNPLAEDYIPWSGYNYVLGNPLKFIDPDGKYPWPVNVRSFIATPRTGVFFRGDGREVNTLPAFVTRNSSRVRSSFIVDPSNQTVSNPITRSDPTMFHIGEIIGGIEGGALLPPVTATANSSGEITNRRAGEGTVSFDFSHEGKDPITPSLFTPALDVNANLTFSEDLENGTLTISGEFTGDVFPSTEAFITDQSGVNLFLGAKKEEGGIHSLFGENSNNLFNVNMQISFDSNGNFTEVTQGDKTYSVQEWNQKIHDEF